MPYQAALTHNNEVELAPLNPQPATPDGVQTPRRLYAASSSYPDGRPYVELTYTILTDEEFAAVNAALGVNRIVTSSEVTATIKEDDGTFANYNAEAHYPEKVQRTLLGWRNVVYRIELIEAL